MIKGALPYLMNEAIERKPVEDIVQVLIEAGAKLDVTGTAGLTPLMRAVSCGQTAIVKMLIAGKADVLATTPCGATALYLADQCGDSELIEVLLEAGAGRGLIAGMKAEAGMKASGGRDKEMLALRRRLLSRQTHRFSAALEAHRSFLDCPASAAGMGVAAAGGGMALAAGGPPPGTSPISELSLEEQVALIEGQKKEGGEQAGKPRRKKKAKRQAASAKSSDAQPEEGARCGSSTQACSGDADVVAEPPRTGMDEGSGPGNSVEGAQGAAGARAPLPSPDSQARVETTVSAAASDDDDDDDYMPDSFRCPITTDVMRDPVTALDGRTYERAAIEAWIELKGPMSPRTNLPLPSDLLIPSVAFKAAIAEVYEMLRESRRCK